MDQLAGCQKDPGEVLYPWRIVNEQHLDPATHSISYAFASAETGSNYLNDFPDTPVTVNAVCPMPGLMTDKQLGCVPGVLKQIDLYLAAVPHPAPDTTFYIWAGGNDIFNNVKRLLALTPKKKTGALVDTNFTTPLTASLTTSISDRLRAKLPSFSFPLLNLLKAKDRLIAAGVKPEQIYFINLPDLAKTPAGINLANGNRVVLGIVHSLALTFNTGLKQILTNHPLSKHNLPASHIISSYQILDEIFMDPDYFNMKYTDRNCVADGKDPLCAGYVFFNEKHPSVATGKSLQT